MGKTCAREVLSFPDDQSLSDSQEDEFDEEISQEEQIAIDSLLEQSFQGPGGRQMEDYMQMHDSRGRIFTTRDGLGMTRTGEDGREEIEKVCVNIESICPELAIDETVEEVQNSQGSLEIFPEEAAVPAPTEVNEDPAPSSQEGMDVTENSETKSDETGSRISGETDEKASGSGVPEHPL
jgi:hypothetical protein